MRLRQVGYHNTEVWMTEGSSATEDAEGVECSCQMSKRISQP